MGCGASKSNNCRDNNVNSNKQTDKPQDNKVKQIEEQKNNFLSDSMQQRNKDAQNQIYYEQTKYPPLPQNSMQLNDNEMQQLTQIKCHLHPNEDIKVININPNVKQKISCFNCILEHKYNVEDLIDIKDVFNTQQNLKFLQKWPKYKNTLNKQIAFDCLNNNDPIYALFQEKFMSIKKSIINYIETYFEQIESKLKNVQQQKKEIKKQFESMNYQSQIKDIFQQNNIQTNELEKQIANLMNKQIKEQTSFEKKIEEYYQNRDKEVRKSHDLIEKFQSELVSFSKQQIFFTENDLNSLSKISKDLNITLYREELVQLNKKHIVSTFNQFDTELINNNQSIQLKASTSYWNDGYLNIELEFNQKYQFQIELFRQGYNYDIYVGLANLNLIKSNNTYQSNIVLYDSNQNSGQVNKMKSIKNRLISEDDKMLTKDITLQVCLKDNIFRWKYNDNINCPKQINCSPNDPLYLFIRAEQRSTIKIKSMKKVNIFEEWL